MKWDRDIPATVSAQSRCDFSKECVSAGLRVPGQRMGEWGGDIREVGGRELYFLPSLSLWEPRTLKAQVLQVAQGTVTSEGEEKNALFGPPLTIVFGENNFHVTQMTPFPSSHLIVTGVFPQPRVLCNCNPDEKQFVQHLLSASLRRQDNIVGRAWILKLDVGFKYTLANLRRL